MLNCLHSVKRDITTNHLVKKWKSHKKSEHLLSRTVISNFYTIVKVFLFLYTEYRETTLGQTHLIKIVKRSRCDYKVILFSDRRIQSRLILDHFWWSQYERPLPSYTTTHQVPPTLSSVGQTQTTYHWNQFSELWGLTSNNNRSPLYNV